MSNKIQPVRGTQDLLPETSHLFRTIDSIAHQTSTKYGYEEIDTPIFEFSDVFHRSLGETSDAVSKETYDFLDRGGDKLTLRPEGTAGVVRAFISNGMAQNLPLKLYYSGPMFRYERPQKGRYRQFHQIGVEALGFDHPFADVESIALGHQILASLGLKDKIQLEINTLGDKESRDKHRDALVNYLLPREKELSQESQIRLHKNPLRILDSKDEGDKKIVAEAPGLQKFLNDTSKKFYDSVIQGLQVIGIEPVQNEKLVRGLDYYTHTVFEFTTTHLGAQGTVLAGGRYDGLVAQLGGPQTPGVGWASGMERLSLLMEASQFKRQSNLIAIIPADEKSEVYCLKLSTDLRRKNHTCEYLGSGNVGKKMKRANKLGAKYAIIVGETEMNQGLLAVKDLSTGEQRNLSPSDFEKTLN